MVGSNRASSRRVLPVPDRPVRRTIPPGTERRERSRAMPSPIPRAPSWGLVRSLSRAVSSLR
jgi:hypothetical protein